MTDFFSDLERQLIDATPRRAQRLRRARRRRLAMLSTILLALFAGGAGLATAIGGSDAGTSAGGGPAAPAPTTPQTTPGATPRHASPTVAVLNGTTVPGLARGVANRLQNNKIKIGNVTNSSDQRRSKTTVTFTPGHADRALQIARLLGLSPAVVSPASARERAFAGQAATVIVTVGSDQNSAPIP
ncbi:MAG: LytR C-terminal domain-containing protein [Solirubrobacterales bacterium]